MRIKLHLMGAWKQKLPAGISLDPGGYLEVAETTTPRDLIQSLGRAGEELLVFVNGKPVDLDKELAPEDRVVLLYPDTQET